MATLQKFLIAFTVSLSLFLCTTAVANNQMIFDAAKGLTQDTPTTLTILYPKGSLPNIEVVAKRFSAATGIKIDYRETSVDDINTRMLLGALNQNSDFDVALPATFGIPDLVEAGALADLSAYAKTYEAQIDYQPSLYSLGDFYKNKFYGYQTDGDTYVMFYNNDWLTSSEEQKAFKEKFGRDLALPTSWTELDELMAFFHRPEDGQFGGTLFRTPRYMVWEWWIRFHAKGAKPFTQDMTASINGAAGVEALEEMIKATEYQHPSVTTNGLVDNWKLYSEGNSFANIGWGGSQKYFNGNESQVKGKLSYATTPSVSYFNWGWNYVVSQFSKNKEVAYLFTLYATTSDASTEAVQQSGFFDPFRLEHYEDEKITSVYSSEFLAAHKQTMTAAIPDLYIEKRGRYIETLEEAFVSALDGQISAQESLDFVARRWDKLTDEIGRSNQIDQWIFLKSKYPEN